MRESYRYAVAIKPLHIIDQLEDPNEANRPHPCVLNAMVLVAYDFAKTFPIEPILDDSGSRYVDFKIPDNIPSMDALLARTQAHCAQSLAHVDRLQDYIQASLLLAYWFFRNGRLLEGQYSMATVTRFVFVLFPHIRTCLTVGHIN